MATRVNYAAGGSFETQAALDGWAEYNKSGSMSSWRDTSSWNGGASGASLRINNGVVGDYGRVHSYFLAPGKYNASIYRQVIAGTTNASFVVRKATDLSVLVQRNSGAHNAWIRVDGDFELTEATRIEVLVGVGSFGAQSAGSARWDRLQITGGFGVQPYFDGSFPDTSQLTYSWDGPEHNSSSRVTDVGVAPPPTGGGTTAPPGWDLVFETDFATGTLPARMGLYDGPSTNNEGTWKPSRVSFVDGICRIQGVGTEAGGIYMFDGQRFGRWEVKLRTSAGNYHPVLLLWSPANVWAHGEIDFSETSNATSSGVYIHDTQGNPAANVAQSLTQLDRTQWHTYTVEWLPNRITVYIDGVQVLNYTGSNGNPTVPMRLVAQLDVAGGTTPQPYNMDIDSIRVYSPSSATSPPPVVVPPNPSSDAFLAGRCEQVFAGHKKHYLRPDGLVKQLEADDKVTSEGTGYLGMEAVQMGDRETVDLIEEGAMGILERENWLPGGPDAWRADSPNDPRVLGKNLLAWDYRQSPFGGNPANRVWDWNYATDADVDRIKYLLWAAARFNDSKYLNRAIEIGRQLWLFGGNIGSNGLWYQHTDEYQQSGVPNLQTRRAAGHHIFESAGQVELNGSYVDPATYHLLADRGADQKWKTQALPGGYDQLTKMSNTTGGGNLDTTVGLIPDWCAFDFGTLDAYALVAGTKGWGYTRSTDYKYDAFRWVHRLAWAVDWYGDAAALALLQGAIKAFYTAEHTADDRIAAEYTHLGVELSGGYQNPMMTAGAVLTLTAGDPNNAAAADLYNTFLKPDDRFATDTLGAYWATHPGANVNYFADFWLQFFYMRKAGLWQNWGQTAAGGGGTAPPTQLSLVAKGTGTGKIRVTTRTELSLTATGKGTAVVRPTSPVKLSLIAKGTGTAQVRVGASTPDTGTPTTPTVPIRAPREKYLVISPDGFEISFDNYEDGFNVLRGVSGRGAPPMRSHAIVIPGRAGQLTTYVEHEPRTLSMQVRVKADSSDGLWNRIRLLIDHLDSPSKQGRVITLRHIDRDGNKSDLFCRCVSGLNIEGEELSGIVTHVLPLVFVADDPYWYGPEITQSFTGGQAPSWTPQAPLRVAASAVLGDIVIHTDSAVPTDPIWTLIGPGRIPRMLHKGLQSEFRFGETGVLAPSERLIVNTQTKEVLGPDGSNWFPRLTHHSLWALQPGVNEIAAQMLNTTEASYLGVAYRDRKTRT